MNFNRLEIFFPNNHLKKIFENGIYHTPAPFTHRTSTTEQ